jgi:hypothetical protein
VQHENEICEENDSQTEDWVIKEQKRRFPSWLKEHGHLFQGNSIDDTMLTGLAVGPSSNVTSCRAYTSGTHARKEEDRLLVEFPCTPTRTRSV